MLRICLVSIWAAMFATAAMAQSTETKLTPQAPKMRVEPVRVQINVSAFVPGANDAGAAAMQAQEMGRKAIYQIAAHECAIVLEVLASECRLESLNVNVQRYVPYRYGNQSGTEGLNINGNIGLRILPK